MRVSAIALLFAAGAACAGQFNPMREDTDAPAFRLVLQSKDRTIEACRDLGAHTRRDYPGCHQAVLVGGHDEVVNGEKVIVGAVIKSCTVYAMRPNDANDMATTIIGHETEHCFFGSYHNVPD